MVRPALVAWVLAFFTLLIGSPAAVQPGRATPGPVLVLDLDGAIGPATTEYVRNGLDAAQAGGAPLVVLRMDTPGGLDSATRDIVSAILASPVPVATFVDPAGSRAASAGTYILYASHLAAMAPGTHLGAATPVEIGGGGRPMPSGGSEPKKQQDGQTAPVDAMSAKVVNDAAAYIVSLAALNGRNAQWAERAVREAATLTAEQAHAARVIELLPRDLPALLAQADGRTVRLSGEPHVLRTAGAPVVEVERGWRIRALEVVTNPNIAFLLLLIGVYGLLFEFLSPGGYAPGVIGAVALLFGLFALGMLPVNFAGLALLMLGIGLMAAEAFVPSIGALGVGGVVAFALGSLLLFKGAPPEFRLSPGAVLVAAGLTLAYFAVAVRAAVQARRRRAVIGPDTLVGAEGRVVSWWDGRGLVQLQGEQWQAEAATALAEGQRVRVSGRRGLALVVEPETESVTPIQP